MVEKGRLLHVGRRGQPVRLGTQVGSRRADVGRQVFDEEVCGVARRGYRRSARLRLDVSRTEDLKRVHLLRKRVLTDCDMPRQTDELKGQFRVCHHPLAGARCSCEVAYRRSGTQAQYPHRLCLR